jgi:hypothetical protein
VPVLRKLPGHPRRRGARAAALVTMSLMAGALVPVSAGIPLAGQAAAATSAAAGAAASCTPPAGAVTCAPATWTPRLPSSTSKTEQIRQLFKCGSLMYAVGSFSQIIGRDPKTGQFVTYARNNVFSFQDTRPYAVTSWNPNVNGQVNSIAVGGKNCSTAYLGGDFTQAHGRVVHDLAAVSTSTGAASASFASNANKDVETLLLVGSRLLTGGYFTQINGQNRKYYVALNSSTGAPESYLTLDISGNYQYAGAASNGTRVFNQQLGPSGNLLLAEGDFTKVGGRDRQQIFMLSLGKTSATVTSWTSDSFSQHCWKTLPFYIRAAAWGPGGTAIYTADTGYQPFNTTDTTFPRTGLCDAAARFPATQATVTPTWINYTGCDSLYSVAAGPSFVYFGGHERWADNPNGCDAAGSGAIPSAGMAGMTESSGTLLTAPGGSTGFYTRARGLGADAMMLTRDGLWIASDNYEGANSCGGVANLSGICYLQLP